MKEKQLIYQSINRFFITLFVFKLLIAQMIQNQLIFTDNIEL